MRMLALPRRVLATIIVAVVATLQPLSGHADVQHFDHGVVNIDTRARHLSFNVEIAKDEAQREQGLMFRQSLPSDGGMWFIYQTEQPVTFWMKNTVIPLDMVFVSADGHVAAIHERAVPMDETPISSAVPVVGVLELNGGAVARLGIQPGDIVHAPGLAN